jgi:methionyl-tRNA formyltransferase
MKIVVIGGVASTRLLVEKLYQHGFKDIHVFGFVPVSTANVSGWADLSVTAEKSHYTFTPFLRVSDCTEQIMALQPELIFAVGLSQLIPEKILTISKLGAVGFHPTALPKGRGRAPIAWLVLEQMDGAATFFSLRTGVDDGPVLVQEPFQVDAEDTAATVEAKILLAEANALDRWLPQLAAGEMTSSEQDHSSATWYGRRKPEDGWIDWHKSADALLRLIRASTHPHPGAYTFRLDHKIIIWNARFEDQHPECGVVGRILRVDESGAFTVQCGERQLITVTEWESSAGWNPKVGELLGYYVESEINALRQALRNLEGKFANIEYPFNVSNVDCQITHRDR